MWGADAAGAVVWGYTKLASLPMLNRVSSQQHYEELDPRSMIHIQAQHTEAQHRAHRGTEAQSTQRHAQHTEAQHRAHRGTEAQSTQRHAEHRAQSTQSTEHRAHRGTAHRGIAHRGTQSTEHAEHRAHRGTQSTEHAEHRARRGIAHRGTQSMQSTEHTEA